MTAPLFNPYGKRKMIFPKRKPPEKIEVKKRIRKRVYKPIRTKIQTNGTWKGMISLEYFGEIVSSYTFRGIKSREKIVNEWKKLYTPEKFSHCVLIVNPE